MPTFHAVAAAQPPTLREASSQEAKVECQSSLGLSEVTREPLLNFSYCRRWVLTGGLFWYR